MAGGTYAPGVGDKLRMNLVCQLGDQIGLTRMDYVISSYVGPPAIDLNGIADGFCGALGADIRACLGDNALFYGIEVSVIGVPGPPTPGTSIVNQGFGTTAAGAMVGQVSGIVKKFTLRSGPKYRGRMFVPFPSISAEDASVPGRYTVGYQAALHALAIDAYAGLTLAPGASIVTLRSILYHKASDTYDFLANADYGPGFATQRRRGTYGKTNALPF